MRSIPATFRESSSFKGRRRPRESRSAAPCFGAFPRQLARRDTASRGKEPERQRVRDGFANTRNDIVKLQAAATSDLGEDHALIFGAHLMLLNDPVLLARIEDGIERG